MKKVREIHQLDYVLCELVEAVRKTLDAQKIRKIRTKPPNGLDVEIVKEITGPPNELRVRIVPVGWPPESYISARLWNMKSGWCPFEGVVYFSGEYSSRFTIGYAPGKRIVREVKLEDLLTI